MNHTIMALVVAGTGTNWARHQLRQAGYSKLTQITITRHLKTTTGGRVSGNVLAIVHVLNTLTGALYNTTV